MQNTQTTPKIYVACLAAYNNGHLHGEWIEANQDAEAISDQIKEMLAKSPIAGAEEWAIHDYEGFCGLRLSEYESIENVAEMAAMIKEHGEAWAKFAEYEGIEYATVERFEEAYAGEWVSEEDFAESLAEETMEIPQHLAFYIDYEKLARDLFINDYFSADSENCKVYVFRRL
ncbi:MAG TPA: antirestriction protein ArdA [Cytophagaceae bacterium]|jgi:antirestriction protein|nr:antirestriction protein ArdA [Cytophagaceae bacterium]